MKKRKSIKIGEVFGRLTVIRRSDRMSGPRVLWVCQCSCENTIEAMTGNLRSGGTKSCGCYAREKLSSISTKHGHTKNRRVTSEYRAWCKMKERCNNKKDKCYPNYGGRGIKICDRWECSFENFLEDMGYKPSSKHSIDRIDVNGDYRPSNCRWATAKEQARNKTNNRVIHYKGKELCSSHWGEVLGMHRSTIEQRLDRGWSVEKALTTPVRHSR